MSVIKSMAIAFSMYSRLPMPSVKWEEKNMRYILCFFPLVGLLAGAALWGLWRLSAAWSLGDAAFALAGTAVPVLVTGGIHMDGFLDTVDALHSYQGKERRLEILKDPHAGAFAVIGAGCYFCLYAAALSSVREEKQLLLVCSGFVLSRILSALSMACFHGAKKEGLLYTFSSAAQKSTVKTVLCLSLFCMGGGIFFLFGVKGAVCVVAGFVVFGYYKYMADRQFGGITGDTAGWFLCLYELVFLWAAVLSA